MSWLEGGKLFPATVARTRLQAARSDRKKMGAGRGGGGRTCERACARAGVTPTLQHIRELTVPTCCAVPRRARARTRARACARSVQRTVAQWHSGSVLSIRLVVDAAVGDDLLEVNLSARTIQPAAGFVAAFLDRSIRASDTQSNTSRMIRVRAASFASVLRMRHVAKVRSFR